MALLCLHGAAHLAGWRTNRPVGHPRRLHLHHPAERLLPRLRNWELAAPKPLRREPLGRRFARRARAGLVFTTPASQLLLKPSDISRLAGALNDALAPATRRPFLNLRLAATSPSRMPTSSPGSRQQRPRALCRPLRLRPAVYSSIPHAVRGASHRRCRQTSRACATAETATMLGAWLNRRCAATGTAAISGRTAVARRGGAATTRVRYAGAAHLGQRARFGVYQGGARLERVLRRGAAAHRRRRAPRHRRRRQAAAQENAALQGRYARRRCLVTRLHCSGCADLALGYILYELLSSANNHFYSSASGPCSQEGVAASPYDVGHMSMFAASAAMLPQLGL